MKYNNLLLMILTFSFALPSNLLAVPSDGKASLWKDGKGKPVAESDSRKSKNGFGAMLLITPDADYKEKWGTPSHTTPKFNSVEGPVKRGKSIYILTLFSNPKIDSKGMANIKCGLEVLRPDGTFSLSQKDVPCFQTKIEGNLNNVFMTSTAIEFSGDSEDPIGTWKVRISVQDVNRNTTIELKDSFELQK